MHSDICLWDHDSKHAVLKDTLKVWTYNAKIERLQSVIPIVPKTMYYGLVKLWTNTPWFKLCDAYRTNVLVQFIKLNLPTTYRWNGNLVQLNVILFKYLNSM